MLPKILDMSKIRCIICTTFLVQFPDLKNFLKGLADFINADTKNFQMRYLGYAMIYRNNL